MKNGIVIIVFLAACGISFSGCNTTSVGISEYKNPAPSVAFSTFKHFELEELSIAPPFDEREINQKAKEKLQEELDLKMSGLVEDWNKSGETRSGASGTLSIQPEIFETGFFTDSESGSVARIADPCRFIL